MERMRQQLAETDWGFLETSGPHAGAKRINDIIFEAAERCIPKKTLHERKSTHPWLTDKVEELVRTKQAAEGTPDERTAAEMCSKSILEEYHAYVKKSATQLQQMPPGNKAWWSKPPCSSTGIPALKTTEGNWEFDAAGKASLFADTFKTKYKLIPK